MHRTVLLVHGAWHGAWCWERVTPLLDAAGVPVVVVDLPSVSHANTTVHDDSDYVRAALDSIDAETVLVGHSYAGAVISEAGVHVNVGRLVYLAGSRSRLASRCRRTRSPAVTGLAISVPPFGSAMVCSRSIPPTRSLRSTTTARWTWRARRSSSSGRNRSRRWAEKSRRRPGARSRRRTSCAPDHAVPVPLQRSNAARIGESVDWPTSHSPFLSRPELVADLLAEVSAR
jgi:hypothetical protein